MTKKNADKDVELAIKIVDEWYADTNNRLELEPDGLKLARLVIQRGNEVELTPLQKAAPELLAALEGLFEHCAMTHKYWGEGCNQKEADKAFEDGKSAIAAAKGK